MGAHDDLLRRFQPVLRYDSNEQFFADSAERYMVNPGDTAAAQAHRAGDGAVIARAQPSPASPRWRSTSSAQTYRDGSEVLEGDHISVQGKDYREQYRRLRMAYPELSNVVYGHAVEANGRLWLQDWLWYFYNDYQLSFALGKHEGDWEMVQFRFDEEADEPDVAVYAQHRYGECANGTRSRRSAAGRSSTSRAVARLVLQAGFHQTEAWYDLADGKRRMKHRPVLEILETDEPAWTRWPAAGRHAAAQGRRVQQPDGPGAKKQWTAPDKMLDNPRDGSPGAAGPKAPEVTVRRAGGRLRVEYDVTNRQPRPHTLVVTVNSEDEAAPPPQTIKSTVHSGGHGKVTTGGRARPAEALRRPHEHDRRRSARPVGVHAQRHPPVRRRDAAGALAALSGRWSSSARRSRRSAAIGSGDEATGGLAGDRRAGRSAGRGPRVGGHAGARQARALPRRRGLGRRAPADRSSTAARPAGSPTRSAGRTGASRRRAGPA